MRVVIMLNVMFCVARFSANVNYFSTKFKQSKNVLKKVFAILTITIHSVPWSEFGIAMPVTLGFFSRINKT